MDRSTLSNKIWTACGIMRRDKLYLLQYVEQVSWMLFLKLFEQIEKKSSLGAQVFGQEYQPILDEKYHWSKWTKLDAKDQFKFVNEELFPHLQTLHGSPLKNTISTLFEDLRNYMHSPFNFKDVTNLLDSLDFSDPKDTHVISVVYEELLLKMGTEGGSSGEFYTPRPVIRLLIQMINPQIGERIFDPFAGSGGFLAESFSYLVENNKQLSAKEFKSLQEDTFYGNEAKSLPFLLGVMNMLLHGLQSPHYLKTNTFAEDLTSLTNNERYNIILTNPPFGGIEGKEVLQSFPLKSSDTELLSLYYVMKKLRVGGRAGIILPEGVSFRTGGVYTTVKKDLIDNYNLYAVVSLPVGIFANVTPTGSGPKTNILFFEKGTPTKETWFYNFLPPKGITYTKKRVIEDSHILPILNAWESKDSSSEAWSVPAKDIIDNDYNLDYKIYVPQKDKVEIDSKPVISSIKKEFKKLQELTSSTDISTLDSLKLNNVESVPLSEILTQVKDTIQVDDNKLYKQVTVQMNNKGVKLRKELMGREIKTKKQFKVTAGQLIFSRIDARNGAIGLVPESLNNAIVSSDFPVFDINTSKIDPDFLEMYLSTTEFIDECIKQSQGTTNRKRLKEYKFLTIEINLPSPQEQKMFIKVVKGIQDYLSQILISKDYIDNEINTLKSSLLNTR